MVHVAQCISVYPTSPSPKQLGLLSFSVIDILNPRKGRLKVKNSLRLKVESIQGCIMDSGSLELKVISAKDLKGFNFFQKLSVYAVVTLVKDELKKKQEQKPLQRQKTPVDRAGDRNPEWNHEMCFDLKDFLLPDDRDKLFLKFDLRCEGAIFGKKTIGEVHVPVFKDLIDEESNGAMRFVRYQIRSREGKPNGVLDFSYRVKNGKIKKVVRTDTLTGGWSPGIPSSDDKVRYPVVEAEHRPRDIRYPSLDDIVSQTATITVPSPKRIPGSDCTATPPMFPYLPPNWQPGVSYHPYHALPSVKIPGIYWYRPEWMDNGHALTPSSCGYSGVRPLGMVEADARSFTRWQ